MHDTAAESTRTPGTRRDFLAGAAAALGAAALPAAEARAQQPHKPGALGDVSGSEHWTVKRVGNESVRLFLWRKRLRNPSAGGPRRGTILFVHGSSMGSTPGSPAPRSASTCGPVGTSRARSVSAK